MGFTPATSSSSISANTTTNQFYSFYVWSLIYCSKTKHSMHFNWLYCCWNATDARYTYISYAMNVTQMLCKWQLEIIFCENEYKQSNAQLSEAFSKYAEKTTNARTSRLLSNEMREIHSFLRIPLMDGILCGNRTQSSCSGFFSF